MLGYLEIPKANFPSMCVDDFFNAPDQVRNYALSLDFSKQPGNYPGLRTLPIHEIDKEFFNEFCLKLFSIFFNYNVENIGWEVNAYFQKIYPYSEDRNSLLNSGWYHEDSGNCFAAGVVYLNPDANLDSGTTIGKLNGKIYDPSLYDLRNKFYLNMRPSHKYISSSKDNIFYCDQECPDIDIYQSLLLQHNNGFDKTLEFKNIYNRMIFYDTAHFHKETNFFAHENEPRLTLVFFVTKIDCGDAPIEKSRKYLL